MAIGGADGSETKVEHGILLEDRSFKSSVTAMKSRFFLCDLVTSKFEVSLVPYP